MHQVMLPGKCLEGRGRRPTPCARGGVSCPSKGKINVASNSRAAGIKSVVIAVSGLSVPEGKTGNVLCLECTDP